MADRVYIAIDLKSFYASVECMVRGLNPMTTNLVVADSSRTEKTICLAVSPSLKKFCKLPGRPRLFEVVQHVREANALRLRQTPQRRFDGESQDADELNSSPHLAIGYITALPRMALYIEYSSRIYEVYLKYIAPEDMHVYSIDEVFIDATSYLNTYNMDGRSLARTIILDILSATGITATAGIGSNMYLAKVAMDIVAKKLPMDKNGVRIAELNDLSYRRLLWEHRPLTDFWRVGKGYARKLESYGIKTMGDVARCSIYSEDLLYRLFGVNAELLIDHAWGWEPCTMADIKAYKPSSNSLGSGQVLQEAYSVQKARLVVKEMVDLLALDLVAKRLVTNQMVLTVGYDVESLTNPEVNYTGETVTDSYGRKIPKHSHGTANLSRFTASTKMMTDAVMELYDRIVDSRLFIRRLNLVACHVRNESEVKVSSKPAQLDLLTNYKEQERQKKHEAASLRKERSRQEVLLEIRSRYGKNAILKGMNLEEGATTKERNQQIGGHKA